jgi:hypothetical protein
MIFLVGEGNAGRGAKYELGPTIFKDHKWGLKPERIKEKYPNYVQETFGTLLIQLGLLGIWIYLLPFLHFTQKMKSRSKLYLWILIIIGANLMQRLNYIYPIFIYYSCIFHSFTQVHYQVKF